MHSANIYEVFSPIHVAWLHRQVRDGLEVTAADLDSIEAAQPEAIHDPLFAEYRRKADSGKLYRKRGPKPLTNVQFLRLWQARFDILDEMEAIRSRRGSGAASRCRGDLEPCYQAAETVARRFRMHISGRSLVKKLSALGIR